MDWEQKLQALNAIGQCKLIMRSPGNWYVSQTGVEIKQGSCLSGSYGNGNTVSEAVNDHWNKLSILPHDQYLVIGAYQTNRRAVRWNGFMWDAVVEEKRT